MKKFTANYCYSNSNFIITNLPDQQVETVYTSAVRIIQNIITRGAPTIASKFLREKLGLEKNYLQSLEKIKFLSRENLNWTKTIKGDVSHNDYPAAQFYDDLAAILNRLSFLKNLTIAEYPISEILPESKNAFEKQMVDFYIPLLKTVIEVDGEGHKKQLTLDQKRDQAFERAGVKVIRISTKEIRHKDYSVFKEKFKEVYALHAEKIEEYAKYTQVDFKNFDLQITLTSVARFQVFILELLDRGVLSLDSKIWNFNVFSEWEKYWLILALDDLKQWFSHIGALLHLPVHFAKVNITVYERKPVLLRQTNDITIHSQLSKRWDDVINDPDMYYMRTDFDDEANYFSVKVSEPVVYSLTAGEHRKHLEFVLENLFGYEEFREGQLEIILNCLNGADTVGLLPTGGGKSLTYQFSVMLQPAISFVVVPIKSLMLDQISNLNEKNFIKHASFINGDLTPDEASKRLRDFSSGKYFFLIISPERFQGKKFREELALVNRTKALSIAVIDEVHCLSEWGHDFRTSYLALANAIRKFAPAARFLALTATASSKVLKDIMNELEIESSNVITISNFTRKELTFDIFPVDQKSKETALIDYVRQASKRGQTGATLVFTTTVNGRTGCFEISQTIQQKTGLNTAFYSGSAPKAWSSPPFSIYKDQTQQSFMKDEIDVLVATKAFGMGIDKGNIRQTIHYGIPGSLESFYQEAGRAGRDKTNSSCVVLYSPDFLSDKQLQTIFGMNTNLDSLTKEQKSLTGDLNTLLYFLTANLKNIEAEAKEIYDFYQATLAGEKSTVALNFGHDKEREQKEKAVYRLALLGIVQDWTLDWKSRQIEVELTKWTETAVINQLTAHIKKYDYMFTLNQNEQQSEQYADLLKYFHESPEPFLKRILFVLLKWYNDNVIYSRKRSMLLMKQYADEFTDSDALHKKIEVYFKRNDDVYLLEQIAAEKERLKDWFKVFYVQEEGKPDQPRSLSTFKNLKIAISRFLESYNNDISLNLMNGMISLAENQFDSLDDRDRMASAVRKITKQNSETKQAMLTSILKTSDVFFTNDQKKQLSEVLIANGFDLMEDLKQIHESFEDTYSYTSMIKTLHSTIREKSEGGYPWEV